MEQKATKRFTSEVQAKPSFEELATSQKIQPVTDFQSLLGHPSAEDESVEEFAAMLREWHRGGAGPQSTR